RRHGGDRLLRASARRLPTRRKTRLHERRLNSFTSAKIWRSSRRGARAVLAVYVFTRVEGHVTRAAPRTLVVAPLLIEVASKTILASTPLPRRAGRGSSLPTHSIKQLC